MALVNAPVFFSFCHIVLDVHLVLVVELLRYYP